MESTTNEITLQQLIQINERMDQMEALLTSMQDSNSTLPKSIENVLNVQLKKLQDSNKQTLSERETKLLSEMELHKKQLKDLDNQCKQTYGQLQQRIEMLVVSLQNVIQKDIVDSCKKIVSDAEMKMESAIKQSTNAFDEAANVTL